MSVWQSGRNPLLSPSLPFSNQSASMRRHARNIGPKRLWTKAKKRLWMKATKQRPFRSCGATFSGQSDTSHKDGGGSGGGRRHQGPNSPTSMENWLHTDTNKKGFTDVPGYSDTIYSDTLLTVTLFVSPKSFIIRIYGYSDTNMCLQWHFFIRICFENLLFGVNVATEWLLNSEINFKISH